MKWVCTKCGKINNDTSLKCVSCHKSRKDVEDVKIDKKDSKDKKIKNRKLFAIIMYVLTDILMFDVWFIALPLLLILKLIFQDINENVIYVICLIYMCFREIIYSYINVSEKGSIPIYFILMTLSPFIYLLIWFILGYLGDFGFLLILVITSVRVFIMEKLPIFFIFFRIPTIIGLFIGYRELKSKSVKK